MWENASYYATIWLCIRSHNAWPEAGTSIMHCENFYCTVTDKQSPPILWSWVFLFGTWQEHLWRLGNAGKHLFRVYWRDWHELFTLKFNISHFEPPKHLAKNAEKCAIDSFFEAEDDHIKIGWFPWAVQQNIIWPLKSHFHTQIWSICHHIYS